MAGEKTDLEKLQDRLTEITKQFEDAKKAGSEKVTKLEADLATATAALKAATEEAATEKAKAALAGDAKDCYDGMDDTGKKKFLVLSDGDRAPIVKAFAEARDLAKKNDEKLEVNGITIFKSKVGAEQFGIFKFQSEEIAKSNAKIAKAEADAAALVVKGYVDTMKELPGTPEEKIALFTAINKAGLDEKVRKTLDDITALALKAAQGAFNSLGHDGKGGGSPEAVAKGQQAVAAFNTKVNEVAKSEGISKNQAMEKVRKGHPDLYKAMQDSAPKAN